MATLAVPETTSCRFRARSERSAFTAHLMGVLGPDSAARFACSCMTGH
ncbi:hypothetical protein [Roseicyclus marinus]|nr:hypothetical protein [Roseicyclus marinus]